MAKKKAPAATPVAQPATPPPTPVAGGAPPPPAPVVAGAPPPAAPVVTPPAAPAAPVIPKDTKNGVTRPSEGTTTRKVWDHADRLTTETGKAATRADVVKACTADGVNGSTATTQFGKWAKYNGFVGDAAPGGRAKAAPAPAAPPPPPAGTVDPAFQAGVGAFASAAAGNQVSNPYTGGTPECDQFTAGWNQAAAAAQAAT